MTTSPEHPIDESPAGYSSAGCSPAEPASASPARSTMQPIAAKRYHLSANGSVSLFSLSQPWGALQSTARRLKNPTNKGLRRTALGTVPIF